MVAGGLLEISRQKFNPVGGHAVLGFYRTNGDRVVVGAFVAHDPDTVG